MVAVHATGEAGASATRPLGRLIPLKVKVGLAAFGVALIGFIGYGIGTNHDTGAHVASGHAYVSPAGQVGVTVGGWVYGFEVTDNGMKWYDADGLHDGGIPPCLQQAGDPWLRFGWASAKGVNGDSWRVVTWVVHCAPPALSSGMSGRVIAIARQVHTMVRPALR